MIEKLKDFFKNLLYILSDTEMESTLETIAPPIIVTIPKEVVKEKATTITLELLLASVRGKEALNSSQSSSVRINATSGYKLNHFYHNFFFNKIEQVRYRTFYKKVFSLWGNFYFSGIMGERKSFFPSIYYSSYNKNYEPIQYTPSLKNSHTHFIVEIYWHWLRELNKFWSVENGIEGEIGKNFFLVQSNFKSISSKLNPYELVTIQNLLEKNRSKALQKLNSLSSLIYSILNMPVPNEIIPMVTSMLPSKDWLSTSKTLPFPTKSTYKVLELYSIKQKVTEIKNILKLKEKSYLSEVERYNEKKTELYSLLLREMDMYAIYFELVDEISEYNKIVSLNDSSEFIKGN